MKTLSVIAGVLFIVGFVPYVLAIFFTFFLLNYAEVTRVPANWLKGLLGPKLGYPLSCPLCYCFWLTLVLWYFSLDMEMWWLMVAPVLHLFVDSCYVKLTGPKEEPK